MLNQNAFKYAKKYTDGNYNYLYHITSFGINPYSLTGEALHYEMDIRVDMIDPPKPNHKYIPELGGTYFIPSDTHCADVTFDVQVYGNMYLISPTRIEIDKDWCYLMMKVYGVYVDPQAPSEDELREFIQELKTKFGLSIL